MPHNVTTHELHRLAGLVLCAEHGYQENNLVTKWENILDCVEDIYRTCWERWQRATQDLNSVMKDVIECRELLGVKVYSSQPLSVLLRRHINNDAQLKKELVASQATCARLQKDQATVKDEKEESCRLSAENSRLSTLLKAAEEKQERYRNQGSKLTAECEELRKQIAALQADVSSGKDKYKDLQDREQSATMELMTTTTRLHEVQSVNQSLENDKKTLQSEIDVLKQEVKRLNDNNTSISSQLASTAASLETATRELSAARQANMAFLSKIDQLSTPVWYRLIKWIKQKLSRLAHLLKPGKEVSDEEEGVALAPTV